MILASAAISINRLRPAGHSDINYDRGQSLGRWLDLLKGRRHLVAVDAEQEN